MINVQKTLWKGLFEWTELEVLSDHREMRRAKQSGLTFKLRVEKLFGQFLDSLTVNEDTLTKIKRECVSILPKYTYTMWYM